MDYVRIDVFGSPLLERRLHETGERAADIEPALSSVAGDLRALIDRGFDDRGLPHGRAWPPLSPDTIARKLRDKDPTVRANATKILNATERLRKSLTDPHDEEHIEHVTDTTLVLSSEVPYAKFHAHGTRNMPARPPVRLREHNRKAAVRKVERWIKTGVVT